MEPVIQWVGGKKRLLNTLKFLMPKEYNTYHEIFLGGACLLLNLKPSKSYSIEKNINIFMIYDNIKKHKEEIITRLKTLEQDYLELEDFDLRKAYYYEKREIYRSLTYEIPEDSYKKTSLLLFINKTCFNAVYRENRKGIFNVPFGNGKDCKICCEERINKLHTFLNQPDTHIFNEDFTYYKDNINEGDFVYIDPPYYPLTSTSFTSYDQSGFCKEDHDRLIDFIKYLDNKGVNVMLSNSNNDYFRKNLNYLKKFDISLARTLNRNASDRGVSKCEMIMTNYTIEKFEDIKVNTNIYNSINIGDIVTTNIINSKLNYIVNNTPIGRVDDKKMKLFNDNNFIMKINNKKSENTIEILIKF